jgi:hypothetical protein
MAVTFMMPCVTVVLVIFKRVDRTVSSKSPVHIYMKKCGEGHSCPRAWRLPETTFQVGDDEEGALERLTHGLGDFDIGDVKKHQLLTHFCQSHEGATVACTVYLGKPRGDVTIGDGGFSPIDYLPDNTLPHHREIITRVIARMRG